MQCHTIPYIAHTLHYAAHTARSIARSRSPCMTACRDQYEHDTVGSARDALLLDGDRHVVARVHRGGDGVVSGEWIR